MKRILILNTCDEWKTLSSFHLFGTWPSTKAGFQRLVKTIICCIEDGTFAYEDENAPREEQIKRLKADEKRANADGFFYDLQCKLVYGSVELSELR